MFAMAWTSLIQDALDRLADAENELGRDPAAHRAAVRAFARAREDVIRALEAAKREAEAERADVRRDTERETAVLRRQFDAERRELREALDTERERLAAKRAKLIAQLHDERENHD